MKQKYELGQEVTVTEFNLDTFGHIEPKSYTAVVVDWHKLTGKYQVKDRKNQHFIWVEESEIKAFSHVPADHATDNSPRWLALFFVALIVILYGCMIAFKTVHHYERAKPQGWDKERAKPLSDTVARIPDGKEI